MEQLAWQHWISSVAFDPRSYVSSYRNKMMDSLRHTRIVLDATYLILNIKQAQRAPKYDNDKKQESEMLEIAPPEHC